MFDLQRGAYVLLFCQMLFDVVSIQKKQTLFEEWYLQEIDFCVSFLAILGLAFDNPDIATIWSVLWIFILMATLFCVWFFVILIFVVFAFNNFYNVLLFFTSDAMIFWGEILLLVTCELAFLIFWFTCIFSAAAQMEEKNFQSKDKRYKKMWWI